LGITGTYLGDYFGILMKERITGFPFNVTDDPMYNGGTLLFLGYALRYVVIILNIQYFSAWEETQLFW